MNDLQHVIRAAVSSGNIILKLRDTNFSKTNKESNRDVVTEADLISEKVIIDFLSKEIKNFSYLSEELNILVGNSDEYWAIDPIDGTANYISGSKNFCVSIGNVCGEMLNKGVVFAPALNDLYYSSEELGSYKNQQKLKVIESNLSDSLIAISLPGKTDRRFSKDIYKILYDLNSQSSGILRLGSASLHLANHAENIFGGCIGFNAPIWDIAAGLAICKNAGSSYKLFKTNNEHSYHYISAPPLLLEELHQMLRKVLR
jgi:myo-inositol-1(or 4)-monophosphatase